MTPQRAWQLRQYEKHLCTVCAKPATTRLHCAEHNRKMLDRQLKRYHSKRAKEVKKHD